MYVSMIYSLNVFARPLFYYFEHVRKQNTYGCLSKIWSSVKYLIYFYSLFLETPAHICAM